MASAIGLGSSLGSSTGTCDLEITSGRTAARLYGREVTELREPVVPDVLGGTNVGSIGSSCVVFVEADGSPAECWATGSSRAQIVASTALD